MTNEGVLMGLLAIFLTLVCITIGAIAVKKVLDLIDELKYRKGNK